MFLQAAGSLLSIDGKEGKLNLLELSIRRHARGGRTGIFAVELLDTALGAKGESL
jgi:hypothetical protein